MKKPYLILSFFPFSTFLNYPLQLINMLDHLSSLDYLSLIIFLDYLFLIPISFPDLSTALIDLSLYELPLA